MLSISNIILLVPTIVLSFYLFSTRNFNYWRNRSVPYKTPALFFGSFLDIIFGDVSPGQYLADLYNEFKGPYFGLFSMSTPFLVLRDPKLIQRILVQDFNHFSNRILYNNEKVDPVAANFILGIKMPTWKILRSKLTPVFTPAKIKTTSPLMIECAENMINYLNGKVGECVETKELATQYTVDVIGSCVFGISINSFADENNSFLVAARQLFSGSFERNIQPLAYVFAHGLVRLLGMQFLEKGATKFLGNVFDKTIRQRELTKAKRNDLIDILIKIKNTETAESEFKFSGDRLLAQAIIFFSAGFETSSSTIAFALYELAMNQNIQTQLRRDIMESIKRHGELNYEALQDMEYLHMVISETLRKYPITAFVHRECVEDYTIPETGLLIERGVGIIISQQSLHWDPQYFPDPQKFDPERFSKQNKVNINKYIYLPFGTGPRSCIGERFALLNVKLGVLTVIKDFIVQPNSETKSPLIFKPSFLLHSIGGVPLTYNKINN